MPYLVALLIFVALSAACWFVSVAVYKNTVDDVALTTSPDYTTTAALAIGVAAHPCVHDRYDSVPLSSRAVAT